MKYLVVYLCILSITWITCLGQENSVTSDESIDNGRSDDTLKNTLDVLLEQTGMTMDILGYFRLLAPKYIADYPLVRKGDTHYTSSVSGQEIPVTTDVSNGYIEIEDEGTGDGFYRVQMALFKYDGDKHMVAISRQRHDGISASGQYWFLYCENGNCTDQTDTILPGISEFIFFPQDYAEEEERVKEAVSLLIELPRQGITAKAHANIGKKMIYCSETTDEQVRELYCSVYSRIRRQEVPLTWNRYTGVFTFSY
jgi:hypothetical protein